MTRAEQEKLAATCPPSAIGLESSEKTLRWIGDNQFAAVMSPVLRLGLTKIQDYMLQEWLLAGWGTPIGELFDLKQLSEECQRRKRWSFFFSSMPLRVPGGVASPRTEL